MVSTVEHPLKDPKTAQWGRPVTHSDYSKLLKGFMPQEMEQKWMVITDTPDAQGNTVVHICRSWTSSERYSLTIAGGNPDETKAKDWATIVKVSWHKEETAYATGELVNEDEVKDLVVRMCQGLCGCALES
jgi:hypothetical protein